MKACPVSLTGQVINPLNNFPPFGLEVFHEFLLCKILLKGGLSHNAQIMEMTLIKYRARFLESHGAASQHATPIKGFDGMFIH